MTTKFDREWFRGASLGYEAAKENIEMHGKAFAIHSAGLR